MAALALFCTCVSMVIGFFGQVDTTHYSAYYFPDTVYPQNMLGPACGSSIHRRCIYGASCENSQCKCPPTAPGCGFFECLCPNWEVCLLYGDPHNKAFGGSTTMLNVPCRHLLTSLSIPGVSSHSSNAKTCYLTAYGTNIFRHGRYFAEVADGEIRIDYPKYWCDKTVLFTMSRNGVVLKNKATGNTLTYPWGQKGCSVSICKLIFYVVFDTEQNYALISSPYCFFRVKFRPAELTGESQTFVPGIAVSSKCDSPAATFLECYPNAICGTCSDGNNLFPDRAAELEVNAAENALLYDFLENGPADQNQGELQSQCASMRNSFSDCPQNRKNEAVKLCGPIFNDRDLQMCYQDKGINDPATIFDKCMIGFCQEDFTSCDESVNLLSPCSTFGPASIHNQNCNSYSGSK